MAPGIATGPSVVLCGYGCLPTLPGMTSTPIVCDFSTFPAVPACMWTLALLQRIPSERERASWWGRCDLQGSQFGHVVKAGDGDAGDVVVVQRSGKRKGQTKSHLQRRGEEAFLKYIV